MSLLGVFRLKSGKCEQRTPLFPPKDTQLIFTHHFFSLFTRDIKTDLHGRRIQFNGQMVRLDGRAGENRHQIVLHEGPNRGQSVEKI